MPFVRITRRYPWMGKTFSVGSEIEVPQAQAERMAAASPPFAEIISDELVEELTQPTPPEPDASGEEGLSFTDGAVKLLSIAGIAEDDYTGDSAEGRVSKQDVRNWLEKGQP